MDLQISKNKILHPHEMAITILVAAGIWTSNRSNEITDNLQPAH